MKRLGAAVVTVTAIAAGVATAGVADAWAVPATSASAATTAGGWGKATGVPGLAALNKGGNAGVSGVSCPSAGNCAAAGNYLDGHGRGEGFVADERRGQWGKAIEVPGLATLNVGGDTFVGPVACGSPGNCVAGGAYAYDGTDFRFSGFIATERGGRWGKAVSLERDGDVYSISCPSGGNCLAAGVATQDIGEYYLIGDAFVMREQAGHWGPIKSIPGLRNLEGNGDPEVAGSWTNSVACPSSGGNCAAGGVYTEADQSEHGFVALERHGRWGRAIDVPGLAVLDVGGSAAVNSVSCDPTGDCVAGGSYLDENQKQQAFVAVEHDGHWGTAVPVPGLAGLSTGNGSKVTSTSCDSSGHCEAIGSYADSQHHGQVFVVGEDNGQWGTAVPLPGLAALNSGGNAGADQLSCGGSAGNCAAGGFYTDHSGHRQGFVALKRGGTWGKATPVPGLGALNKGGHAEVFSVSCPAQGNCAAGGSYLDRSRHHQGFVVP